MKRIMVLLVVVLLLGLGWRISSRLSADAIGLATGVVFGVLAGLPAAVLVLATSRRRQEDDRQSPQRQRGGGAYPYGGYPHQPPVIVLANPTPQPQMMQGADDRYRNEPVQLMPPPVDDDRQFHIIGEPGELDEEYR